mmetsp:Transcript_11633/g.20503  ORF Transcript_11633/g.20503 Transcript_11633/m.20503 type:complete len:286 (+) Transcript_11633:2460-3317(+)
MDGQGLRERGGLLDRGRRRRLQQNVLPRRHPPSLVRHDHRQRFLQRLVDPHEHSSAPGGDPALHLRAECHYEPDYPPLVRAHLRHVRTHHQCLHCFLASAHRSGRQDPAQGVRLLQRFPEELPSGCHQDQSGGPQVRPRLSCQHLRGAEDRGAAVHADPVRYQRRFPRHFCQGPEALARGTGVLEGEHEGSDAVRCLHARRGRRARCRRFGHRAAHQPEGHPRGESRVRADGSGPCGDFLQRCRGRGCGDSWRQEEDRPGRARQALLRHLLRHHRQINKIKCSHC